MDMPMPMNLKEVEQFLMFWGDYGQQLIVTLAMLVGGIIVLQKSGPLLDRFLCTSCGVRDRWRAEIVTAYYVVIGVILIGLVLWNLGLGGVIIRQVLMALGLTISALMLLLRPYIPTLPFRVGDIIKTGSLIGRVEGISLVSTRLRTFDGLTIFVPNAKILNDYVVNYHSTPNRRIKVDVNIRFDQDLVKAKKIIEALFVADPRVLPTPRPLVYVTAMADYSIHLAGRGWARNAKVWITQCELIEKLKYRLEQEGIQVAFPRTDLNVLSYARGSNEPAGVADEANDTDLQEQQIAQLMSGEGLQ